MNRILSITSSTAWLRLRHRRRVTSSPASV